jgi:hypothetical protein
MKYICLGYIEPGEFENMSESERNTVLGERHSAAVLKRPADPCPDDSPVSHADCMGKELAFVVEHLDAFVTSLRGVLATSTNKDAQNKLDILNKTDAAWRQYRVQV